MRCARTTDAIWGAAQFGAAGALVGDAVPAVGSAATAAVGRKSAASEPASAQS